MIHNFKYTLKTLFRNKALIFWTFAFPIILGIFFNMAFSDIENSEKLDMIDIAIVNNETFKTSVLWQESFKILSDPNSDTQLFNTKYVTEEKAKELLNEDKITGYLLFTDTPKVVIHANGINETILKYVTEEIATSDIIVQNMIEKNLQTNAFSSVDMSYVYANIYQKVFQMMNENSTNIKDISSTHLSYTMIEFYTLIAMACLYGGILGTVAVNQNLANMSSTGKRISVSPTSKGKLIFGSVMASYLTQLIGITLLFLYTIFVLKVDYGNNLPLTILLAMVGSLAGLSLGVAVATLFKTSDNTKMGIILSITMLGCFLAGMMGITMKYVIDKNVPIINKLNPASMITDGFYALYYYDTLNRYYFNVISLLIFSMVLILISILWLRRQKYDSI